MKFTINDLSKYYHDVREGKSGGCNNKAFYFRSSTKGGDYLEIYIYEYEGLKDLRIIVDNFPLQRKFFSTNIPIRSIDEFESILERIKVEIPKRYNQVKCFKCGIEYPESYFLKDKNICVSCK